jgi:hypothetical protein
MKITELKNAPEWLKNAVVENENVEIDIYGNIIWKSGIWKSGTWESGTWVSGTWESGIWKLGLWESGTWESGLWKSGTWVDGTWKSGTWKLGTWKSGTWEYGTWESGTWEYGTWKGGESALKSKYTPFINFDLSVSIGCKTMTIEDWVEWFENSTEEFETPRNTPEFKMIRAHFYAVKAYVEAME